MKRKLVHLSVKSSEFKGLFKSVAALLRSQGGSGTLIEPFRKWFTKWAYAMSRRESILTAAERLLNHYGVAKTTMADIAREASVGVGTVYLEFDSKDAIIEALAEERHQRILTELRDACSAGRRYEDRIKGFLETRYRMFQTLGESGEHASDLVHCSCDGVVEAWKRYESQERGLLVELLECGVEDGELDVADPELTAAAIFRVYASFAPPHLYRQETCSMNLLQEVHHLMLRGLLAR